MGLEDKISPEAAKLFNEEPGVIVKVYLKYPCIIMYNKKSIALLTKSGSQQEERTYEVSGYKTNNRSNMGFVVVNPSDVNLYSCRLVPGDIKIPLTAIRNYEKVGLCTPKA